MKEIVACDNDKKWIELHYHEGPFDKGVTALRNEGLDLITARDLAEARLLAGAQNSVARDWTWTAESFNYFPNGEILIASQDHSPLSRQGAAEEATECFRRGKEFYLDERVARDLRERAETDLEKAVKSGILLLSGEAAKNEISIAALKDEPLFNFLFHNIAEPYCRFLKEAEIYSVPVYVARHGGWYRQAFSKPLWVDGLNDRSGIDGNSHLVHDCISRVTGMRRVLLEHLSHK